MAFKTNSVLKFQRIPEEPSLMVKETGGKSKKQLHQTLKKEPMKKSMRKRPHTLAAVKVTVEVLVK